MSESHHCVELTCTLQFGHIINVSSLAVTLVAGRSIATEASFAHLVAEQSALVCICGDETSLAATCRQLHQLSTAAGLVPV